MMQVSSKSIIRFAIVFLFLASMKSWGVDFPNAPFEAETQEILMGEDARLWQIIEGNEYSGGKAVIATGGFSSNPSHSSALRIPVFFHSTGQHKVVVTYKAPNGSSDSFHFQLDSEPHATFNLYNQAYNQLTEIEIDVQISEIGYSDIRIFTREDGMIIDKIEIQSDQDQGFQSYEFEDSQRMSGENGRHWAVTHSSNLSSGKGLVAQGGFSSTPESSSSKIEVFHKFSSVGEKRIRVIYQAYNGNSDSFFYALNDESPTVLHLQNDSGGQPLSVEFNIDIPATGIHQLTFFSREPGLILDKVLVEGDMNGTLRIYEAEDSNDITPGNNSEWRRLANTEFSSGAALIAKGGFSSDPLASSARMDIQHYFPASGPHKALIFYKAEDGSTDSFHFGVNGTVPTQSIFLYNGVFGEVTATEVSFNIDESGHHSLNFYTREAGFSLDKIVVGASLADSTYFETLNLGRADQWIVSTFSHLPILSGDFTSEVRFDADTFVQNATSIGASKYGFISNSPGSYSGDIAVVNTTVWDVIPTASDYAAGFATNDTVPNKKLYIDNVHVEPNFPYWVNWSTNYDGLDINSVSEFYAEDLTINGFNADGGIDNKADISQFVRLSISGPGNRSLRYWRDGPHYIVDSDISNFGNLGDKAIIWIEDCQNTVINVYNSTFNGFPEVPADKVSCENSAEQPNINYLTQDPKFTGEMHPMFSH